MHSEKRTKLEIEYLKKGKLNNIESKKFWASFWIFKKAREKKWMSFDKKFKKYFGNKIAVNGANLTMYNG